MRYVYSIIYENGMNDLMNEKIFGNVFGYFERVITTEKKYFKKSSV